MAAGRDFGRIDLEAARNFAIAAQDAGVRRIVYLGGLVPDDAQSEHIVSRRDTGEVLRKCTVPVTEIRAGVIVGPGSAAFEVMRDLVLHLPLMVTPRWVQAVSPPIALDNLLEYLVELPGRERTANPVYDAAGPESLTYAAMMRIIARCAGKRAPRILPVPVLTPRLSAYWLKLVTAVPTRVARALIEGLRHDFHADDAELRRLVPQRLLGFEESVQRSFTAERQGTVSSRWTEGAFWVRRRQDHAYYAKRAAGSAETPLPPSLVWQTLCRIGGRQRYFYANWLWWLRELLDWCVGGNGLQHGRRDPSRLRVGDVVDSWSVIGLEEERRLTLVFGMKAPGAGLLEFELRELDDGGTRLTATAYWHPAGVWGLLYWYAMFPAHLFIFAGMTRAIVREAGTQVPQPG
jgi:uncharacterized protein YbjT (DUF2867 family)